MSLEELNKDIYDSKSDLSGRAEANNTLDPTAQTEGAGNPFLQKRDWDEEKNKLSAKQKKRLKAAGITLLSLLILGGAVLLVNYLRKNLYHEDRVSVSIEGPQNADSAQSVKYTVKYENKNWVKLKNAQIVLDYSENFQPDADKNINLRQLNSVSSSIYIGDIEPRQKKEIEVSGIFYAPKDTTVYLHAALKYSSFGSETEHTNNNQISVNIATAPMLLEVSAPSETSAGDQFEYVIDYKNLDSKSLGDAQIKVDFPSGFELVSSDPAVSQGGNVWYLGVLDAGVGGKIRIQGRINSGNEEDKIVLVQFGRSGENGEFIAYNRREKTTHITKSAILISQEVEDNADLSVDPGGVLRYLIRYQNLGDYVLNGLVVNLKLDSRVVDVSKISIKDGHFDSASKTITWKSSDFRQLESLSPGESGDIRLTIPILNIIPVEKSDDKNFTIQSKVWIDSNNFLDVNGKSKTVFGNDLAIKLNSKVIFTTEGYYNDKQIKNSGPLPPKVGFPTTYTFHWSIMNVSNDLEEVEVKSSLPSGIQWTGQIYPPEADIKYNEQTNEIVWKAGSIAAGVGLISAKKEAVFQVSLTPQVNQINQELRILNESQLLGKDAFTGKIFNLSQKEKTTQLAEDPLVDLRAYKVEAAD